MTTPSEQTGCAVPEGFVFPWNTTVTLEDAWARDAQPVQRDADDGARFQLVDDRGHYLHKAGHRMTGVASEAWCGGRADLRSITRRRPETRFLKRVVLA